jgi:hypothetical protein
VNTQAQAPEFSGDAACGCRWLYTQVQFISCGQEAGR